MGFMSSDERDIDTDAHAKIQSMRAGNLLAIDSIEEARNAAEQLLDSALSLKHQHDNLQNIVAACNHALRMLESKG